MLETRAISDRASWARWGWVVTTLALGCAVIWSAWASWRSTRQAADDVIHGEAQVFLHAVIAAVNRAAPAERSAALDSVVQRHAFGGLRFAALARADGEIVASAGAQAALPIGALHSESLRVVRIAARRLRVSLPLSGDRRLSGAIGGRPIVLVEFEPVVAETLTARVRDTLFLVVVVAVVLVGAGLQFWRISLRVQEHEHRLLDQRRLAALGQMSAVLAHEIRNPLASLKGHAQLLVERLPGDAPEHRNAARVASEATRLEGLTADLLEFARSGPIDVRPADPIAPLRGAALDAGAPEFEIERDAAPREWPLDGSRMRRALANVLQNALQAAPAPRPPKSTVGLEDGRLVYVIRDFGPGLPPGEESRIFEPFFTTRTSGTGLGLAVARRIVELHGGRITASNAPDRGAEFRIELPPSGGLR